MSKIIHVPDNLVQSVIKNTAQAKYIDLQNYINEVNKPDNREAIVRAYGDQLVGGMYGLCEMMGATKVEGKADQVTYWEEARLHKTQDGTIAATSPSDTGAKRITTATDHSIIDGDVLRINGRIQVRATSVSATTYDVVPYKSSWGTTFSADQFVEVFKVGNEFAQATDQPTEGELSNIVKREQNYIISKFHYETSGSQLGNVSWIIHEGNPYYYYKGLDDVRKRAENYHEAMALFAQVADNANLTGSNINGAEGYSEAVENRGVINQGYIKDLTDLEDLVVTLKKQRGVKDYMVLTDVQQQLFFDRIGAAAAGSNGTPSYGVFSNEQERGKGMALNLGFSSLRVGGVNFHCKPLEILIDPKFNGNKSNYYKFFMVPMDTVPDPKSNIQAPMLEKNVKGYGDTGQLRYMEHWKNGAVNGVYNDSKGGDKLSFEYRSECTLITRGANAHVVGLG